MKSPTTDSQSRMDAFRRAGEARAKSLSKSRRSEIASIAASARWKGHKPKAKKKIPA